MQLKYRGVANLWSRSRADTSIAHVMSGLIMGYARRQKRSEGVSERLTDKRASWLRTIDS